MILGQNLLASSMIHRVVDEVQSRLAVDQNANRLLNSCLPLHLKLELAKEADFLSYHREPHVLRFIGAQTGIPHQLIASSLPHQLTG